MISPEELLALGNELFGRKTNKPLYVNDLADKIELLRQCEVAKLKNARQQKMEFAIPGEDWGTL